MFSEGFFIPNPTQAQLVWAAVLAVGMFFGAVFMEIARRRRERKLALKAEWRAVEQIIRERELPERQWKFLRAFLDTHAAKAPLRAVTVRHEFDACVDGDIADAVAVDDPENLERRGETLRDIRVQLGLDYIPFGQRIHNTRELYPGQALWVARKGGPQEAWTRMDVTTVDEAHFHLMAHGKRPDFDPRPGEEIQCRMWREEDARYVFEAPFVRAKEKPYRWMMRHFAQLRRMQSRAHFRIRYEQAADVGLVEFPLDGNLEDVGARAPFSEIRGRFTSLSGGGFALMVQQPVSKQVLLRVRLDFEDDGEAIEVTACVVDVHNLSAGRYLVRAAYVDMDDALRDRITHYAFSQQQRQSILPDHVGDRLR